MSFGGETIDQLGVTRRFPSASMVTGLIANALGYERIEHDKHQRLQDRLVFASRIDRNGTEMTDYQTAAINNKQKGWTTRGHTEGRDGGTYQTHQRWRDYYSDGCVTVALRLDNPDESPTLGDIADALDMPKRPLFIGRKPCIPSSHINQGVIDAGNTLDALVQDGKTGMSVQWNDGEDVDSIQPSRTQYITDQRNWQSGLHGGGRKVHEGTIRK